MCDTGYRMQDTGYERTAHGYVRANQLRYNVFLAVADPAKLVLFVLQSPDGLS